MTPLPGWLLAHLTDIGAANPDRVARRARLGTCAGCRRAVVRGLDGDRLARPVTANAYEIDELGEFVALAAGLTTSHLRAVGREWFISVRWREAITAGRTRPVLADHHCDIVIPPAATPVLEERPTAVTTHVCPF